MTKEQAVIFLRVACPLISCGAKPGQQCDVAWANTFHVARVKAVARLSKEEFFELGGIFIDLYRDTHAKTYGTAQRHNLKDEDVAITLKQAISPMREELGLKFRRTPGKRV